MQALTIKIENDYSDGHHSEREVVIVAPLDLDPENEDWWNEEVFDHTGDGHGLNRDLGSCYTATILAADNVDLLGKTWEWVD